MRGASFRRLGVEFDRGGHEVPNEANWHIHDGTGPGPLAGSHHAGLAFFSALFAQEGLFYGKADAPYVRCPNATDKVLLPNAYMER